MNLHCRMKGVPKTASDFLRTLDHCGDGVGRLTYQAKRPGERFSTVQNGQRKLLLTKIELLCMKDPLRSYKLVYACVAPGSHLPLLAGMIPNVHFHLYDPRPISIGRRDSPDPGAPAPLPQDNARAYAGTDGLNFVRNVRRIVAADGVWRQMWHRLIRTNSWATAGHGMVCVGRVDCHQYHGSGFRQHQHSSPGVWALWGVCRQSVCCCVGMEDGWHGSSIVGASAARVRCGTGAESEVKKWIRNVL
jgi:hypothetical protein